MINEVIKKFKDQLLFEPEVQNSERLQVFNKFVVAGMGGSALAADLLRMYDPHIDLIIHRSYDLPDITEESWKDRLVIASSYSGDTEETVSAFEEARIRNLPLAVISVGGKLIEFAKEYKIPYIELPNVGIQPRTATGYMMKALLKLMKKDFELKSINEVALELELASLESKGKQIAETLRESIPVIYASHRNRPLSYYWKIAFNETGKVPSFANAFSELNHNEMEGFDLKDSTRELSSKMYIILLRDENDHPRIKKRMDVTERILTEKGIRIMNIELGSGTPFEKIFRSIVTVMWAAYYTAQRYGVEAERVPMVEDFKRLILE